MPRIELAREVADDFDRIIDHLIAHESADFNTRINAIMDAISVLETSPLLGRPVESDLRELVIGRATKGYVALYRFLPEIDTVFVLAVRAQAEAGYYGS